MAQKTSLKMTKSKSNEKKCYNFKGGYYSVSTVFFSPLVVDELIHLCKVIHRGALATLKW